MYPAAYFPVTYFTGRYWPKVGYGPPKVGIILDTVDFQVIQLDAVDLEPVQLDVIDCPVVLLTTVDFRPATLVDYDALLAREMELARHQVDKIDFLDYLYDTVYFSPTIVDRITLTEEQP